MKYGYEIQKTIKDLLMLKLDSFNPTLTPP